MCNEIYHVDEYECHQCPGGFCKVEVYSNDEQFDTAPKDCIYATAIKAINEDVKPIWVKV